MGKIDLVAELRKDNPLSRLIDLQIFAGALESYHQAAKNIQENGVIVLHPRTGAPIDNPYFKVQSSQIAIISKYPRIKSDRTTTLLVNQLKNSPAKTSQ